MKPYDRSGTRAVNTAPADVRERLPSMVTANGNFNAVKGDDIVEIIGELTGLPEDNALLVFESWRARGANYSDELIALAIETDPHEDENEVPARSLRGWHAHRRHRRGPGHPQPRRQL